MLSRRFLFSGSGAAWAATPPRAKGSAARAVPGGAADDGEWAAFRARFVAADGRVVDTGNGGISHSEGQGWGLFFAVAFGDERTFDRIMDWTSEVLRRRNDALHAWRYIPGGNPPVGDPNNATDADVFIAWSLARAADRWGRPDLASAAAGLGRDILRLLTREVKGRIVLLPGASGFVTSTAVVVNPSYYVLPGLSTLSQLVPNPLWERVVADGLRLIGQARFGRWRLPPDWLQIELPSGTLSPAPAWPPRFSYDAIRVPLYLTWGERMPAPLREALTDFWMAQPGASGEPEPGARFPAWADLRTDAVSPYPAATGFRAVADFTLRAPLGPVASASLPSVLSAPDYYSAALSLLTRVAASEISTRRPNP